MESSSVMSQRCVTNIPELCASTTMSLVVAVRCGAAKCI